MKQELAAMTPSIQLCTKMKLKLRSATFKLGHKGKHFSTL